VSELETLKALLDKDWNALTDVGVTVDGFQTVDCIGGGQTRWHEIMEMITRGPSGQNYRWTYGRGLTECQEEPLEPDTRQITPVVPALANIEVLIWTPGEGTEPAQAHTYVPFVERNDNEGETWTAWIQLDGNEAELGRLAAYLTRINGDSEDPEYTLDLAEGYTERDVDVLIKHGADGYMAQHRRLVGRLVLGEHLDDSDGEVLPGDLFYKGGINDFMKES
jgi:hypothetical protein